MNFDLGPDELALQGGIRDLCRGRFPLQRLRERERSGELDRAGWDELAAAGVFSLRLPEDAGGAGLGWTESVLVFEELGRALIPGPLVATHLAAGLIAGAAEGDRVIGVLERGPRPLVVEHLASLDDLVVLDAGGLWRLDPARLDAEPVPRPLDPLTPLHVVAALPPGEPLGGPAEAAAWRAGGAALTAANLVGLAAALTDLATAYAKERRQFDRPIGAFQAVKHLLADMLVRAEVAGAAVHAAGVLLDGAGNGAADRAVAGSKLLANEAAYANGKAAVQVFGGMGFTWEVDVHRFLKRAVVLRTAFGCSEEMAEAMASFV